MAATLGIEALYRSEAGAGRLLELASLIPPATPPDLSLRFLKDAVDCFLLGLDKPCIAMCRGAIEVLVEQLSDQTTRGLLGKDIADLRANGRLSELQASAMFFINGQAKEVLHDEVAPQPLDPVGCLRHLAVLLGELHPQLPRGAT